MKNLKCLVLTFCLFISVLIHAQEIEPKEGQYTIKDDKVFLNDEDVTTSLTTKQLADIKSKLKNEVAREEKIEKAKKEAKKAEKKQKKAEKKQKKAEKALKKRQKAESNLAKSQKKYSKSFNKYEKLRDKGKLSPKDEIKWLDKLEGIKKKVEKNKKKLKRL
ncbi:MAG: hypothetical protein L3J08_00095 [Flavobacteriaceae bacterium]|nr:hypothetical protein [Flavobacteriaceae bacterium]